MQGEDRLLWAPWAPWAPSQGHLDQCEGQTEAEARLQSPVPGLSRAVLGVGKGRQAG